MLNLYFVIIQLRCNVNWMNYVITWNILWNELRHYIDVFMWKFKYGKLCTCCELITDECWCICWVINIWYYVFQTSFIHSLYICLFALDCGNGITEILIFGTEISAGFGYWQRYWYLGPRFLQVMNIIEVSTGSWGLFQWIHGLCETPMGSVLSW